MIDIDLRMESSTSKVERAYLNRVQERVLVSPLLSVDVVVPELVSKTANLRLRAVAAAIQTVCTYLS
jgi:hypothetical protein